MAQLNAQLQAGLQEIARLVVSRAPYSANSESTNLFRFGAEFRANRAAVLDYLAAQVSALSSGRLSVRELAVPLRRSLGLVLCDSAIPPGEVAEVPDDMFVFMVRAANPGYVPC